MPPLLHPRIVLARLQAELRRPVGQGHVRRADIQALVAYVQRCLRVMPWVRHAPGCQQSIRHGRAVGCTCGLTAAWLGAGPSADDTANDDTANDDTTNDDTAADDAPAGAARTSADGGATAGATAGASAADVEVPAPLRRGRRQR